MLKRVFDPEKAFLNFYARIIDFIRIIWSFKCQILSFIYLILSLIRLILNFICLKWSSICHTFSFICLILSFIYVILDFIWVAWSVICLRLDFICHVSSEQSSRQKGEELSSSSSRTLVFPLLNFFSIQTPSPWGAIGYFCRKCTKQKYLRPSNTAFP